MSRSPFLNQIRERIVALRYAKRTIETYLYCIKLYILHHGKKHPSELSDEHIEAFLSHLANQRNVSVSTQKAALNALVFLYTKIMDKTVDLKLDFNRAAAPRKLPVVLTPQEIKYLLDALSPTLFVTCAIIVRQWIAPYGVHALKSTRY